MSDSGRRQGPKATGPQFDQLHDVQTVAEPGTASDEAEEVTSEQLQSTKPTTRPARPPTHRVFVTGVRVRPIIDDDDDDDDGDDDGEAKSVTGVKAYELPPGVAPYEEDAEPPPASNDPFDMPATRLSDPDQKKKAAAAAKAEAAKARDAAVKTEKKSRKPVSQPAAPAAPAVKLVDEPKAQPEDALEGTWQLAAGDIVGKRYTIIRPIARGGMAEVYLAEQEGVAGFAKKVVIKRILSAFVSDRMFIEHFVREANLASSLTHEHVAQVYDLGKDRGSYFIAMEYIPGVTLAELASQAWNQGRSLSVELILLALADAAEGLVYGWRTKGPDGNPLRLVHRDISPDNLIVNTHGTTKVLDYGVAKAADSADLTNAGEIKGKLSYIPPELVLENKRDHRSDLYALGVTGYYLCTGKRPFWAENPTVLLHSILRDPPPAPRELNPQLPPVVEKLLLKLLAKDPDERFEDGQAMSEAIHRILGAVRRAALGRFVAEVMKNTKRRAIPDDAPAAVVTIGLSGGASETPTGEWEQVPEE